MKKILILLCALALVLLLIICGRFLLPRRTGMAIDYIVKHFPFTKNSSLTEWEEKIFKGKVVYTVEGPGGDESYVKAESKKTASALFYKVNLDVKKHPVISWKWRVEKFPEKKLPEQISLKKEEDFAARIYVIFPAAFFTHSKVVEYIWAEELPVGTSDSSAYSKNIKMMVLRSGRHEAEWFFEERDIFADYVALFGKKPRLNIGAIAFMTDADSTKTEATSFYDEIKIGYKGED